VLTIKQLLSWMAVFVIATSAPSIARDRSQVRAFRVENPCPATGLHRGACPGWNVDHVMPLCAGRADTPRNMQWIRTDDHRFKTLVDVRECRRSKRPD
jgi:hypothetical protein